MICRSWQSQNSCRCSRQKKTDTDNDRSTPIEEDDYEYVTCSKQQDSRRVLGIIMIALIGVLQAVGTLLVGIGGVVLKVVAVLMFGAAGLLFFISDFSGLNALVVILLSTVMFWLPELFALVLVGLAFLQGKIADTFM